MEIINNKKRENEESNKIKKMEEYKKCPMK